MTELNNYKNEYSAKKNASPYAITAGGVVYKKVGIIYEYLLLVRKDTPVSYHLPKGTLHIDETLEDCARREILEETGMLTRLTAYLGATTDQFTYKDVYFDKTTHYYAAGYVATKAPMDSEHDGYIWCTYEDAINKLAIGIKQEQRFLNRCLEYLHSN